MAEVEIISSCLVPTYSCPISRLELTPWDLLLLQKDPIQKGILFRTPNPTLESPDSIINHLKNSFAHTLDYFPPLAGRLGSTLLDDNKTSFYIDCNNVGAEFTYAVANAVSISDLVEPKYIPDIIDSLFPLNGVINFEGVLKPLLGVQVTMLVDGFFIGCSANHSVMDGTSFWHFINSWAELSRGLGMISKFPIFQRCFPGTCLKGDGPIPLPPLKQYGGNDNTALPPVLRRFFHFRKATVAKLKAKANFEAGTDKISSFQAVMAHLWRSILRSSQERNGDEIRKTQGVFMCLGLGARPRFPLPDGYFGNAVYICRISVSESDILENSLGHVAQLINELIRQHSRESRRQYLEDWLRNPTVLGRNKVGPSYVSATSSARHSVYSSDFGWGKPVTVRSAKSHQLDGMLTFFPAPEAGGIDVEVCLKPETMKNMDEDIEFLEAFSIFFLS